MKFTLTLSDIEVKLLKNDLLDIKDWFEKAKDGKINNCKKRFLKEWYPKLTADPEVISIPANEENFINMVVARSDYKDREERDAEEQGA